MGTEIAGVQTKGSLASIAVAAGEARHTTKERTRSVPRVELGPAVDWLVDEVGISRSAAEQMVEYLAAAKAALGCDAVARQPCPRTFL